MKTKKLILSADGRWRPTSYRKEFSTKPRSAYRREYFRRLAEQRRAAIGVPTKEVPHVDVN